MRLLVADDEVNLAKALQTVLEDAAIIAMCVLMGIVPFV